MAKLLEVVQNYVFSNQNTGSYQVVRRIRAVTVIVRTELALSAVFWWLISAAPGQRGGRLLVQRRTETITELTSTVTTKLYTCISGFATTPLACTRRRRRRLRRAESDSVSASLPPSAA